MIQAKVWSCLACGRWWSPTGLSGDWTDGKLVASEVQESGLLTWGTPGCVNSTQQLQRISPDFFDGEYSKQKEVVLLVASGRSRAGTGARGCCG